MGRLSTLALVALAVGAEYAAAHGHLDSIVVNGVFVQGYNPTSFPYAPNGGPITIGWPHVQPINEFISPVDFGTPDIICHKDARPAQGHYEVAAGTRIMFKWDQWPSAHQGPIIDALAPCDGPCESVDKTKLEFFKIAQTGLLDPSKNPGWWAADILLQNNFTWVAQIPENLAPGNYVWRQDMIALHAAGSVNGAQSYPMCLNFKITGSGTYKPKGSRVQTWYDTQMVYDLYSKPMAPYVIPGPDLDPLFSSSVSQGSTKATATATATPADADSAPAASDAPATAPAEPASTTEAAATFGFPATSATAHHVATTSSVAATATAKVNIGGGAPLYGQCGGLGWTGPTSCAQGKCSASNQYYSQCVN